MRGVRGWKGCRGIVSGQRMFTSLHLLLLHLFHPILSHSPSLCPSHPPSLIPTGYRRGGGGQRGPGQGRSQSGGCQVWRGPACIHELRGGVCVREKGRRKGRGKERKIRASISCFAIRGHPLLSLCLLPPCSPLLSRRWRLGASCQTMPVASSAETWGRHLPAGSATMWWRECSR